MTTNSLKMLEKARKLRHSNQGELALAAYRRYLNLQPKNSGVWADVGSLLLELHMLDEACKACDRALTLDPRQMNARLTLAEGLMQKRNLGRAAVVLTEAVQQAPADFKAHELLRLVLYRQENWTGLHAEFERYLDARPSDQTAWEKCCLNLLFGHMPLGWEQYELRWQTPGIEPRDREQVFPQPRWRGESFVGKTLLLRWEQGFGDAILFVRYAPLVKARGGRVLLEVLGPLVDLLATCPGIDEVIRDGDPLPPFDLQLPLLSLPRIFQTDLDSIPAEVPYLFPDKAPRQESIDRILGASEGLTRVGLGWAGSPKHPRNADRSVHPALLKPLEVLPGVVWHSFQMEPEAEQPFPRIIPMAPVLRGGFSDTAYALARMDLVITVDTALAHLAGALGIPTFLLVHTFPDFRWLMGRNDSPWYPTMRIYRQSTPGDWTTVIERVVSDLTGGS